MAKKLNSMRALDAAGIAYDVLSFPHTIHSAQGVADYFGLPSAQVYKTLVLMTSTKTPILMIVPGNRELQVKRLGQILNDKRLRMATHQEAETLTGLKVGGISALALRHRPFSVYLAHTAREWDTILVSAGQKGVNLRVAVDDLIRATNATIVEAPMAPATPLA